MWLYLVGRGVFVMFIRLGVLILGACFHVLENLMLTM